MDLKRWREENQMTQVELARRLGLDSVTISRWERGVMQPRGRLLEFALAELDRQLAAEREAKA